MLNEIYRFFQKNIASLVLPSLFFLSIFVSQSSFATQEKIIIDVKNISADAAFTLGGYLYHADTQTCKNYTAKNISQCPALKVVDTSTPNYGFSTTGHWFVFTLVNNSTENTAIYTEVAYPLLDHIKMSVFNQEKQLIHSVKTGDHLNFNQRPLAYPTFVFPIYVPKTEKITMVFFIESGSSMQVPINLWRADAFIESKKSELLLIGILLGTLIIMALYQFLLFISTRNIVYFYFVVCIAFYALVESIFSGLAYAFIWPEWPKWNDISLVIVSNISLIGLVFFTYNSYNTKKTPPFLVNAQKLFTLCAITFILLTPFINYQWLIMSTALLIVLIPLNCYLISIILWRRGQVSARFFVLAFTCFALSAPIFVLNKFGLIEYSLWTENSIHIAASVFITLLSLALADRVNQQKTKTETAQNQAIMALQRFQAIYNNATEGLFRLSTKGRLLAANPALINMFDATAESDLITYFKNLKGTTPIKQALNLEKLKSTGGFIRFDTECTTTNGAPFWGAVNARLVTDIESGKEIIEGSITDISERKANEKELSYLANHDTLTKLLNRNAFNQRLQRVLDATNKNIEHSLLFIDLDRFKIINDSAGHLAGDELLKQLAIILQSKSRQRDTVARIGGDEFVILMENCLLPAAVAHAETLLQGLNDFRFNWQSKQFTIGACIGVVSIDQFSANITELMHQADSACLMAKELGRNRVIAYSEQDTALNERLNDKNMLVTLQEALEQDHFILHQQPIVSLEDEGFYAYEVLLRMSINDEIIMPGAFLPAAARYKLMTQIDSWVVTTYLKWLASKPKHAEKLDMVTLNLSAQSLSDKQFLSNIADLISLPNIPAEKICFEITESEALTSLSESSKWILQLKKQGVRFALDDFGSGYASYSYLAKLPIDIVKIDGVFCIGLDKNPINHSIIKSITEIAHLIGLKVVAEFVENQAVMDCLKSIDVDYVQGYHIAKSSKLKA